LLLFILWEELSGAFGGMNGDIVGLGIELVEIII
jgi:cobalamin synthase